MKIGKYELKFIETGTFGLDGGAMFGIIPKPLWNRTNPSDDQNRVTLGARSLLLDSGNRKILIDTGIGSGWEEKFLQIYRVDQSKSTLRGSLAKYGIRPEEITDVILTHLHFDHTGGSTELIGGNWMPAFPNARYYVQKKHFEWAQKPSERDKGSFIENRFLPLYKEGILHLLDSQTEFDDEIEFIIVNGHTISQQMVKISDSSSTLLYCGDLLPFASHVPLAYVMAYDLQPLQTVKEKKELYTKAIEENWILLFEHDPEIIGATISATEKSFVLNKVYTEL